MRRIPGAFALALAVVLSGVASSAHAAAILFQSAMERHWFDQGPTVDSTQFLGVRFSIDQPVTTTDIGGVFAGGGTLFGAVVALTSFGDFPDSTRLTTPDVLGVTLLDFPRASASVSASLPLTLEPGFYGLIFGSGLFGANGSGSAPYFNIPVAAYPAFFVASGGASGTYFNGGFPSTRFFVSGSPVPEPSSLAVLGSGLVGIGLLARRRTRRRSR